MSDENRKKTVKTRPGRNGGTLKADAGPGRPKGSLSLTAYIKKALAKDDDAKAKILADAWIMQAAKGNGVIAKQLWDRVDGPVTDKIELSGPGGGPIQFQHELDRFYGESDKSD